MSGDGKLAFSVLGSGSGGNCVLVRGGGTTVLVDAGLSARETIARMTAVLGAEGGAVDAILLTHEHGDHVAHASSLARRLDAPLLLNDATRQGASRFLRGREELVLLEGDRPIRVGALEVLPLPKPHDASGALAFVVRHGGATLGIFTDLGTVDAAVEEAISHCTALVLESNHDPRMLAAGPYPARLKARVGGGLGHLSNDDCARAVARSASDRLSVLVLGHISTTNNTTQLVREASIRHLGARPGFPRWLSLQDRPTPLLAAAARSSAAQVSRPGV